MPSFKNQYSFDGAAITVSTEDPHWKVWASNQRWVPCEHLRPLITALLAKGAHIESADTGWSKAKLVVTLGKGLNPNVAQAVAKEHGLEFYENNDSHYLVAYGWFCEHCQQGIDWPQGQSTINAI